MNKDPKKDALRELAQEIRSHNDWWLFPAQDPVQGFMGTDPIFIVGDQPSNSEWRPEHPSRRALYRLLENVGVPNAHLTDLYKRRGKCSALRAGLPADFDDHVRLFRREIAILQPTRIVALGNLAYGLLKQELPECAPILAKVWHFSYVARYGKLSQYEANMRRILGKPAVASAKVARPAPQSQLQKLCEGVQQVPCGAATRRWTLRADNHAHHHGIVRLMECPLHLELFWRPTSVDSRSRVGIFRLDLAGLLHGRYVRPEPAHSSGPAVRLRIVLAGDRRFYVQANHDGPRILLSNEQRKGASEDRVSADRSSTS